MVVPEPGEPQEPVERWVLVEQSEAAGFEEPLVVGPVQEVAGFEVVLVVGPVKEVAGFEVVLESISVQVVAGPGPAWVAEE